MSRLCSIHHDIHVTIHTPAAYGQWSVFHHNGENQLVVLGTRYGIWWPWYGQFEVGWLQPLQLWLGAWTSSVAPVSWRLFLKVDNYLSLVPVLISYLTGGELVPGPSSLMHILVSLPFSACWYVTLCRIDMLCVWHNNVSELRKYIPRHGAITIFIC